MKIIKYNLQRDNLIRAIEIGFDVFTSVKSYTVLDLAIKHKCSTITVKRACRLLRKFGIKIHSYKTTGVEIIGYNSENMNNVLDAYEAVKRLQLFLSDIQFCPQRKGRKAS